MQDHGVIEKHQRNRFNDGRRGVAFVQGGGRTGNNDVNSGRGFGNRGGTSTHYANRRPPQCP